MIRKQKIWWSEYAGKRMSLSRSLSTLLAAFALILLWGVADAVGRYQEAWAFALHTAVTCMTFLAVYLIQSSAKRRSADMQLEFSRLKQNARYIDNPLVHVEEMTDAELDHLHAYYQRLSNTKD